MLKVCQIRNGSLQEICQCRRFVRHTSLRLSFVQEDVIEEGQERQRPSRLIWTCFIRRPLRAGRQRSACHDFLKQELSAHDLSLGRARYPLPIRKINCTHGIKMNREGEPCIPPMTAGRESPKTSRDSLGFVQASFQLCWYKTSRSPRCCIQRVSEEKMAFMRA